MELGRYVSALSNAAATEGKPQGYLVWGVRDSDHGLTGTSFNWNRSVSGEPLEHWLARQVNPGVAFSFREAVVRGFRIVVLEIPAAQIAPTAFAGERYIRIGSSKERLSRYPERESLLFSALRAGPASVTNTASEWQDHTFTSLFTYYAGRGIELREEMFKGNLCLLYA